MAASFDDYPSLIAWFDAAGIKIVDIGGRGSAFKAVTPVARFADYYVSEPDAEEADRLQQQVPTGAPWRSVTVLREAIGSTAGRAPLFITQAPGMSSLLEPDLDVAGRFYVGEGFRVVSSQTVSTVPLDDAAVRYGCVDASFLKLDTQGTELDILGSGPRLLDSVVAVHTEAAFHPLYKGQALFGDVDSHLRQHGFSLVTLSRTNLRRAGHPEALYSKRVAAWAHCLYFREPATLAGRKTRDRDVPRLLAFALVFQHHDLALELLTLARRERICDEDVVTGVTADVQRWMVEATTGAFKRGDRLLLKRHEALADLVLGPSFRDKRQFE